MHIYKYVPAHIIIIIIIIIQQNVVGHSCSHNQGVL